MTCICQGSRCQVCRMFEQGGTVAQEFSVGAPWGYDETGQPIAEVYDLRACSCPKCWVCRDAPKLSPAPGSNMSFYDTPAECEWDCAASL